MEVQPKRKRRRFHEYPEEVRKRAIRIKVLPLARTLGRFYARLRLPITERKRKKAMESAFKEVSKQTLMCKKEGYESTLAVFNLALYLLIAERDISTIKDDALTHPDPWKRNLFLRMILLTLYEWDMDEAAGKNLKKAFIDLNITETLQTKTFDALREIRKVQQKAKKKFVDARNGTIAHRYPNALLQYETIQKVDTKEIFEFAGEFYVGVHKLNEVMPQIILEAGTIQAFLKQKLKSVQEKK